MNWTLHLLSLCLVFQCHLISLGIPSSTPLISMHLRILASFPDPWIFLSLSVVDIIKILDSSISRLLFGMVLLNLLYIFLTPSCPKPSVSSIIQTYPNLSNLSLTFNYFLGYCSLEMTNIIPDPLRHQARRNEIDIGEGAVNKVNCTGLRENFCSTTPFRLLESSLAIQIAIFNR